jgi:hypothetical protein
VTGDKLKQMKKAAWLFAVMFAAGAAYAQMPKDSLYMVTYVTGPTWDHDKSPQDQAFFKEHSSRLSQLRKEGTIKFGARYGDKGIIVVMAANREKAKDLVNADQAVINKLFVADVQKLNIFYDGCLEKIK